MPPLSDTLVVPQEGEAIELDEMWSFVQCKKNRAWVWVAIAYKSRQVLALVIELALQVSRIGDRSAQTCQALWQRIPLAYRSLMVYSDFWQADCRVVPREQHHRCKKGSGLTNTVERFNLTGRQRVGRMVRKTLSFSKSWQMHLLCLMLFVHRYNHYCLTRFASDITNPQKMHETT